MNLKTPELENPFSQNSPAMTKLFIGIDPGLSGAIVGIFADKVLAFQAKMPVAKVGSKNRIFIPALLNIFDILHKIGQPEAIVESVHAMPKQGVTSMFSMGYGLGAIHACLDAKKIPYVEVPPQTWKKNYTKGLEGKDASVVVALKLFPEAWEWIVSKRGARDHNLADALLMAEYLRSDWVKEENDDVVS